MTFLRKCLAELRARHQVEQFEAKKDRNLLAGKPNLQERSSDLKGVDEQNGVVSVNDDALSPELAAPGSQVRASNRS